MIFLKKYLEGFTKNTRNYYPEKFNFNISIVNLISFGLTSLLMFFFYQPLGYLFFLIMLTSTEADGNISGNSTCNKIIQKLDILVILITIIIIAFKINWKYYFFIIPLMLVHDWKRYDNSPQDYENKMNIWHFIAGFISVLSITIYSITKK